MDVPLGRRVELARHRRGLSRRALGDLVGRSTEWIRQVERGERSVDRLSILLRLATVLHVGDPAGFVGSAAPGAPAVIATRAPVEALRDAVYRRPSPQRERPRDDGRVRAAWAAWHDSATPYRTTLEVLPPLLEAGASADAYRLAGVVLRRLGEGPAALLAAERAVATAEGDPAAAAAYADTLVHLGAASAAEATCRHAVAALPADAPPAVAGRLHLAGARAAAAAHDPPAAQRWLAAAARATRDTTPGGADPRWPFGVVDVEIAAVRVALRLGRLPDAIRLGRRVDVGAVAARVRRCRGYLTMAGVHSRAGNPPAVLVALAKAEHECAEELRYNGEARRVVAGLLDHDDALIRADVRALATRLGVC